MEAASISLLGSVVGIALGTALTVVGAGAFGMQAQIQWTDFLMLAGFSVMIGAVFGVYPAVKASRLRPVDALRDE